MIDTRPKSSDQEIGARSPKGGEFIARLREACKRPDCTLFDRTLLHMLDSNPSMTIRQCWNLVAEHNAQQTGNQPISYPLTHDN